jgi:hypothetical protein
MSDTKHDDRCKMSYGRPKWTGCPRCEELINGAAPRTWKSKRERDDHARALETAAHFASEKHRSGGCGPVCTFGEW